MVERRRVDIKSILRDPDLSRELLIPTLQATQAREDIATSREQAERAYYVVTQTEKTAFFRLIPFATSKKKPERREEMFVAAILGEAADVRYDVPRRDFKAIEGAPLLAYDRLPLVAELFRKSPPLDPAWAHAAVGLQTSDDLRFVRNRWEIPRGSIGSGNTWVPFAKGGEFSRFYADVNLVVLWRDDGGEIRDSESAYVRNERFYFRSGLTWPSRTAKGFNLRQLPPGCVFAHKGPALFPKNPEDEWFLSGVGNSQLFEFLLTTKTFALSWEVGTLKSVPVAKPTREQWERISILARKLFDEKAAWDKGNETSTQFWQPWLLQPDIVGTARSLADRLTNVDEFEKAAQTRVERAYDDLNAAVFELYGVSSAERRAIEGLAGERPPELVWPQMESKSTEQKRMEHVFRLLSYLVKRVLSTDDDGIVPFEEQGDGVPLIDRVRAELKTVFAIDDSSTLEVEIANELKKQVSGYRRTTGIADWLENAFFEYHVRLYDSRPVIWHVASAPLGSSAALNLLVDYLKFDSNRMAKLRGRYISEARALFRRESAIAAKENRDDARLDWDARLEELNGLDARLQKIEEGYHEGAEGGERDYRILTPWKLPAQRPRGWNPDLNDGVAVNLMPLQKAGVLRILEVL